MISPIINKINVEFNYYSDKKTKAQSIKREDIISLGKEIEMKDFSKEIKKVKEVNFSLKEIDQISFDKQTLMKNLHPGDILLSYYPNNHNGLEFFNKIDFLIRTGQKITKLFTKTSNVFSENFVHLSMYVGEGKLAEAIGNGVELSDLESDRIKLKANMTCGYLVVRLKDALLAKEASYIAYSLAEENKDNKLKYSIPKAIIAGITNSTLNPSAMKRYLKGAAYAHTKIAPMDKNGVREFFCSYYITWSMQAAESKEVIAKVNAHVKPDEKIIFPDLVDIPDSQKGKYLDLWAESVVAKHYHILKKTIKLDIDAKFTTPQRFYGFVLEHPELFVKKIFITPPLK